MSNSKGKLSIIVPVYNVELWLNKCIDSLLNQTYEDIEIILINDGSTDKSGSICDEYSKKDNRIKVMHITNSGQSVARNKGLDMSQGEYVLFVDSDDYLCDREIIEKFVNILSISKCDFIYTSYCRFNDGNEDKITEILPINLTNKDIENKLGKNILGDLINKNSFHHAPYLKICRRGFILDNNLYFREGYYHEDVEWSFKVFYYAKKIIIYNEAWYMRRMRENSTITSRDEKSICKKVSDRLIIANELIKFFEERNVSRVIIDDLVRMYWGDLMITRSIKESDNIKKCANIISSTRNALEKSYIRKYLIGSKLIKYFGASNFIKLLRVIIVLN